LFTGSIHQKPLLVNDLPSVPSLLYTNDANKSKKKCGFSLDMRMKATGTFFQEGADSGNPAKGTVIPEETPIPPHGGMGLRRKNRQLFLTLLTLFS